MQTDLSSQNAGEPHETICPTCALSSSGRYCPDCGEQLDRHLNRTLRDFFSQSLTSLLHIADSKLGRSLWTLFRRPGTLTLAYIQGSRVPYMHPFRVFLVANVLFFLMASLIGSSPLTTRLGMHMHSENFYHQPVARQLVEAHVEEAGIEFEVYEASFNRRVGVLAKSLVLLMLPLFALVVGVLMAGRGELAVKHLAFSCHFYAHLLLYNFVAVLGLLGLVLLFPAMQVLSNEAKEILVSTISMLILMICCYFAVRRAYKTKRAMSLALSLVMAIGVYFILFLYRAMLFFAAFYSLKF